jgi:hypothetical protein
MTIKVTTQHEEMMKINMNTPSPVTSLSVNNLVTVHEGATGRLKACTTRDSHPLGYVKTAVILARRHDRERLHTLQGRIPDRRPADAVPVYTLTV